ncbi:MAG: hypothetical protein AB9882_02620 [Ignavibacteriaceae bacterium]
MIPQAQLKALMLCSKGTLTSSPTNVLYMGDRASGGMLTIEPQENITDYLNRDIPNKIGIKAEMSSLQMQVPEIETLINHVKTNRGADVQVITALVPGQTQSPNEGIFNLSGDNFAGLEYEIFRSNKEAYVKITAEAWYDYTVAQSLIQAAATNAANAAMLTTLGGAGINFAKIIRPNFDKITLGAAVGGVYPLLATKEEVQDWSIKLTGTGEKTQYGRSIIHINTAEIEVSMLDSSITKINEMLAKDPASRLGIDILFEGGWESWVFNLLTFKATTTIEDKKRMQKLNFKGDVYLNDIVFSTNGTGKFITLN